MECFFLVLKVQEIAAELNEATGRPGYRTINGWLCRERERKVVEVAGNKTYKPEEIEILERYVLNENRLPSRKKVKKWMSGKQYKKSK